MMMVLSFVVFAGALATSVGVVTVMIVPRWQRIARLVGGHIEPEFMPLATLAVAERRIAVRRYAAGTLPTISRRWREAA